MILLSINPSFILALSLFLWMGCGETPRLNPTPKEQAPPQKKPDAPGKNAEIPEPRTNLPHEPENNPEPEPIKPVHQADPARLNALLFAKFQEHGSVIVRALETGDETHYRILARLFDDAEDNSLLPITTERLQHLKSSVFTSLDTLKPIYQKAHRKFLSLKRTLAKASDNELSESDLELLSQLSPEDQRMIEALVIDMRDKILDNGKIRKEFEPYILNGLSTDITLDTLYKNKDPELVKKIHRTLVSALCGHLLQGIYLEKQLDVLQHYNSYFTLESAQTLLSTRQKKISTFLISKYKELIN